MPRMTGELHALSFDPSSIVREAAAWALGHGHRADAGARSAIELARTRERDDAVRAEMGASLE